MQIDGKTRIIPLLAYPSDHIRTPSYFNPLAEQQGRNAAMIPWQVAPEALPRVWEGLGASESVAGVVVTIPHKIAAAGLCDELVGAAKFLKVANVARRTEDGRWIGAMFDGEGYVAGLRAQGHEPRGRAVLQIGAGGAGAGIAHALMEAGVSRLTIANRTREKAKALARALNAEFGREAAFVGEPVGGDHDIVINATSAGLKPEDPTPIDIETIRQDALVGEVIMQPDVTPLLRAAEARGMAIHKGEHMILAQTERMADFFFGPP